MGIGSIDDLKETLGKIGTNASEIVKHTAKIDKLKGRLNNVTRVFEPTIHADIDHSVERKRVKRPREDLALEGLLVDSALGTLEKAKAPDLKKQIVDKKVAEVARALVAKGVLVDEECKTKAGEYLLSLGPSID